MKNRLYFYSMICGILMPAVLRSQTVVYTEPLGYVTVSVPAQSDAVLAVPMQRPAVFQGRISSISGNDVTLSATPTLPSGTVFALVLASGTKEGMVARISSQAGAVVTVTLAAGDDLTGITTGSNGDRVKIMPYWTPASLIPATAPAGLQVLGFENAGPGINVSSTKILTHAGNGAWENGVTGADAAAEPLAFGAAIVVRNPSNAAVSIPIVGAVPVNKHRLNLSTLAANTAQDIRFGYGSPVLETLDNVGLGGAAEGDQIFVFDNAATGYNKSADQLLIMEGGVWKDQISNNLIGSSFQFTPGFGYVYRKAATPSPSTAVWSALPGYLPLGP